MASLRRFKLKGTEPWLDRLQIMTEVCLEMTPLERFACLQYLIIRHNQGEFTETERSATLLRAMEMARINGESHAD